MQTNFFGAILAFGVGVFIAAVNYKFSQYVLRKHTSKYAIMQIVRQFLQIAYLIVLFVASKYTPWDMEWLLVGGVIGITLPMFWFTYQLVKLNNTLSGKEESDNG